MAVELQRRADELELVAITELVHRLRAIATGTEPVRCVVCHRPLSGDTLPIAPYGDAHRTCWERAIEEWCHRCADHMVLDRAGCCLRCGTTIRAVGTA